MFHVSLTCTENSSLIILTVLDAIPQCLSNYHIAFLLVFQQMIKSMFSEDCHSRDCSIITLRVAISLAQFLLDLKISCPSRTKLYQQHLLSCLLSLYIGSCQLLTKRLCIANFHSSLGLLFKARYDVTIYYLWSVFFRLLRFYLVVSTGILISLLLNISKPMVLFHSFS